MGNMKRLHADLERIMSDEYARAAKAYGAKFHSPHEGYGVILEEYEEAMAEAAALKGRLDLWWLGIKGNCPKSRDVQAMREYALQAAAEFVQVAAMAHKALQGYEGGK